VSRVARRKLEHLDLCATRDVESRRGALLDEVHLLHDALPDSRVDDVDLSVSVLGRELRAPIVISGMTGGAPRAGEINRALATAAQKFGFAMGLGSQRAMQIDPELAATYRVRDVAPDVLLFANVGAVQLRDAGPGAAAELVEAVHADALCVHLNPAQELVQDEGDRDFRGCLAAIEQLVRTARFPLIVKETGCGLAPATLARLRAAGVRWVDVSGAGGTTWTGVEALRGSPRQQALGTLLREWGIPTAASVCYAREAGLEAIASGGIRDANDIVRALALGARLAGLALPFLRAHEQGGVAGASALAESLTEGLRALMLLVGVRSVAELPSVPRVLGPQLSAWIAAGAPR
jgi:isopentenyl-diphosphate delta-isomerase